MNIRRLTKTFLTLSLADVASRAGLSSPEEAEKWLVIMIEEGSIFASISQRDGKQKSPKYLWKTHWYPLESLTLIIKMIFEGMVRFDTNPERYNSVSMLKKLEGNIVEAMGLDMQVTAMDEEICLNSVFISRNLPAMMQQTLRRNSDYEMVTHMFNFSYCTTQFISM
jgi:COP9 signalosome complex subunit 3